MSLTVLVTDGNERPALAVVRSLGRRGVSVVVGDERSTTLAGSSKYCHRTIRYPSPYRDSAAFVTFLTDFLRRTRIDVVLPVTDVTTRLVAGSAPGFGLSAVAVPPLEAFEAVTDKRALLLRAASLGIPVPQTKVIDGKNGLPESIDGLVYPVVIKPSRSRMPQGRGWIAGSVHYARDPHELRRLYGEAAYLRQGISLIQEHIEGPGTGLFAICDRGRVVTTFAHRRLREKPPTGGVSVLCESIPVSVELRAQAERLLTPLGWHGVAMLEYKENRRSGRPLLMEVNGRFWGSLQLAIDAGVDFPFFACQLALGCPIDPPASYRIGVRSRWFLGDVDHLLWRFRHGRLNLTADAPSTLSAIGRFLATSAAPHVRNEILRPDDYWPAVHEARAYLGAGWRALFRWRRKPTPAPAETDIVRAMSGTVRADCGQ
jgi:predicted ATP-grasp superfamily ATP-dependent carboligase